jgi:exopolysaccharide/PEP-CTERM locus tyrosine autokinase
VQSDDAGGQKPGEMNVLEGGWDERLLKVTSFSNEFAESFRILRSKILRPADGSTPPKSILVTSALAKEGKSFVSANLGISLGRGVDQHSLLVDCDLRLPSLAGIMGVGNDKGLVNYLRDGAELSGLIKKTAVDKISILPSGVPPVNPSELLGSERMHDLVEELSSRYPDRFVIFDTPPFQVASEAIVLSQVVDGVVLVVREGMAGLPLLRKVIADIGRAKIIGVVFNGHRRNSLTSRLMDKNHDYYGEYYENGKT